MENNLKRPVLTEQIKNLPLSNECKEMAKVNGFETLEEIVSFTVASLMKRPKFSMHVYLELYKFLGEQGYGKVLKME